jgi:hypothetical protein
MVFHPNRSRQPQTSAVPVDQFPALASHAAAAPTFVSSYRSLSVRARAMQFAVSARQIGSLMGVAGSTTLVVGTVLAVACTLWAVRLEVPFQVALLAGYITLAATVCICAALVVVRYSAPATETVERKAEPESPAEDLKPALVLEDPKPEPRVRRSEPKKTRRHADPDYAAWKRAGKLRVADAARLWCGMTPGCHATAEVMAWASTILDAVDRGELPKSESAGILAQYKNGWHTEIQWDALTGWARSKGHSPRFLGDEIVH